MHTRMESNYPVFSGSLHPFQMSASPWKYPEIQRQLYAFFIIQDFFTSLNCLLYGKHHQKADLQTCRGQKLCMVQETQALGLFKPLANTLCQSKSFLPIFSVMLLYAIL